MNALVPETAYVETLWNGFQSLRDCLLKANEPVMLVETSAVYSKAMILAAGNWFERKIGMVLQRFAESLSNGDGRVIALIQRKAIKRQFHTLFDWDSGKPHSFLALFGEDFKEATLSTMKTRDDLLGGATAFMTLVAERNLLAHDQKLDVEPQFTTEEVLQKFREAVVWVLWMENRLVEPKGAGAGQPDTGAPESQKG